MFKTKKEKYAYVQGMKKAKRGGELFGVKKAKDGVERYAKRYNLKPIKENSKKPVYYYDSYISFDKNGKVKWTHFDY